MERSKKKFDVSQITEFFTVKEAAAEGHLHPVTVRNLFTRKKLTRYKLGRKTLIRRSEFMALIQPKEIVAQD
jgi:excisionase family DNA binding protein